MNVLLFEKQDPYLEMRDIAIGLKEGKKKELLFNIGTRDKPIYLQKNHNSFTPFNGGVKTLPEILSDSEITPEKFFLLREFEKVLPTLLEIPKKEELYFSYENISYDNPSMTFMRIENISCGKLIGSSYSFDVVDGELEYAIHNERYSIGIDLYHTIRSHLSEDGELHENLFGEKNIITYLRNTGNLNPLKRACDKQPKLNLYEKIFLGNNEIQKK